jgi:hypothetical protein
MVPADSRRIPRVPRFWKILDEVTGNKALALRKELKNHHSW